MSRKQSTDLAARIFGFVIVLAGTVLLLLQSRGVQTSLARRAVASLEDSLDGRIEVGSISIEPFNSFKISDISIIDKEPYEAVDTFFTAGSISGKISFKSIFSRKGIYLSRVKIENAMMHLTSEPHRELPGVVTSNLSRIFGIPHEDYPDGYFPTPDIFQIGKVQADNFTYRQTSYTQELPATGGIDWTDFDITASLRGHNLKYTGGRMSGVLDAASARENKTGYEIKSLSGRARVGMGKATIEKIHFKDPYSDLYIPLYSMAWKNVQKDFDDFVNRIRQEASIASGTLGARTVYAYSGVEFLRDSPLTLEFGKSHAQGYINDLHIDRLKFTESGSGIKGDVSATLTGLTEIQDLLLDARINSLDFTAPGITSLLSSLGVEADLSNFAKGAPFSFSGQARGPLNRLDAAGKLSVGKGSGGFNLDIRNLSDTLRPLEIRGTVDTRELDLGMLTGAEALGKCTANTGLRATLDGKKTSVIVDSLMVDRLGALGYDYTGIAAAGKYSGNAFDGKIICADPNLNFIFQGIFNLSQQSGNALYKFYANVGYADLQALNLDKRGTSKVSGRINTDFMVLEDGDIIGDIAVSDLSLENDLGPRHIGDLLLSAHSGEDVNRLQLKSGFLEGGYAGSGSYTDILRDLQTITTRRELPALYSANDPDTGSDAHSYELSLDFHDSRDLLSYALPGLYIADSTRVDISSDRGRLEGRIRSPRLAWGRNYLKGVDISLDNLGSSLNATVVSDEMNLAGIGFSNSALTAYAQENNIFAGFHYDGIRGLNNVGEIYLAGDIFRDAQDTLCIRANPLSSYIRFDSNQWDMDESQIYLRAGDARIDGFRMHNGDQVVSLDGGLSANSPDTLSLGIRNVDMSVINYFTTQDYDIRGRTSGKALLSSPLNGNIRALANIACDSLTVSGTDAGTIRAAGIYDSASDLVNVYLRNIVGEKEALAASGSYKPDGKYVDLSVEMDRLNLVMARPFAQGILDDMSGGMSGTISAKGPLDRMELSSRDASIDSASFKLAFTGVQYTVNGPLHIDNGGIHFDDISVTDDKRGSAMLSGGIGISDLSHITMDAGMKLRGLEVLERSGGSFGGNIFADGDIYISGPTDAILLEADLATAGEGRLMVYAGGSASASRSDLLTFTSHEPVYEDPYEGVLSELFEIQKSKSKGSEPSDFMARVRITTNSGLQAQVDLDETGENRLNIRGDGTIGVNVRPSKGLLDISGDYNITDGRYRFAIPGIVSKDFSIDEGSSITFNGDVMESLLDIGATYSLRTSLNRLLADTSAVSTRRQVECGIRISDHLSDPSVNFSIDVPDLDPVSKAAVESALNTEDKLQKQFVALLVTGSFLPDEQSGIVNNNNFLYSNMAEIVAGQLSNMLTRLDIPLDMDLAYQQSRSGRNLFDLAVSTELFNNRVVVNGSVGNRQYSGAQQGEVVGDMDIDIKLDPVGQFRLKLFSHSADEYTNYLDYSQRNGVGVSYQKEFNTWRQLFRNLFSGRKARERMEAEEALRKTETITVGIDE